ncbi:IF factor, partial [Aegotheles bennettii]|nr:IF factor [Aegotheles bennettii]
DGDGVIGNIYSTGLALQALVATSQFYAPREWDCAQAFSAVSSHDYQLPMAMAQVLPALLGKSYLDVATLDCTAVVSPSSGTARVRVPPTVGTMLLSSPPPAAPITVHYTITNELQGTRFTFTTSVKVLAGSTLLKVLQAAREEEPNIFSFQTEQTSWGPMVVSIHGLAANAQDRTYWKFLSSGDALQQGVGTYKPWDGEHVQAVFSTY